MFDLLPVITCYVRDGVCTPSCARRYFQQIGFKIAPGVNPADYCLDVLSGHARPVTNTLELGPRYDAMTFLKYHWNDHSESSPFRAISDHTDHQVAQVSRCSLGGLVAREVCARACVVRQCGSEQKICVGENSNSRGVVDSRSG